MNSYFTSLLQPQIRRKKKGTQTELHYFSCPFTADIQIREATIHSCPDIKKGDKVYFYNSLYFRFWCNGKIIEPELCYDASYIPCVRTFPFLITDYKFSPDFCFDHYFKLSKCIRERIVSNLDTTKSESTILIGRKKWTFVISYDSLPFTKHSYFSLHHGLISCYTPRRPDPMIELLEYLFNRLRKWYKYHMG
jgi:hypothetical protein